MLFNKNVAAIYFAFVSSFPLLVKSSLRARGLTVCDTLKACYLVNIQTRAETELDGSDTFELDLLSPDGYAIRCDVNADADLDFIKFFYDGKVHDEFGLPRYMAGDSDQGVFINKVDYLSTCGKKTLKIEGHVWSNLCFEKDYNIEVTSADGEPCSNDVPTNAPAKPPSQAAPVKSPVKPPTKAPTPVCPYPQEWIDGCCKNICKNDYICPANSYRSLLRSCYDNFDDCYCGLGYKKSITADKCIRVW